MKTESEMVAAHQKKQAEMKGKDQDCDNSILFAAMYQQNSV